MNNLLTHKRIMILNMLVEGTSIRSISRTVGVSINTVSKLLGEAGEACAAYHDESIRNVKRVRCVEIWSFVFAEEKTARRKKLSHAGDEWTLIALDSDHKMILSNLAGDRSDETENEFTVDLASRQAGDL